MEGLEGCVGSLDFLHQEPLRASSQRKAWAELCGTQDVTGRDRRCRTLGTRPTGMTEKG